MSQYEWNNLERDDKPQTNKQTPILTWHRPCVWIYSKYWPLQGRKQRNSENNLTIYKNLLVNLTITKTPLNHFDIKVIPFLRYFKHCRFTGLILIFLRYYLITYNIQKYFVLSFVAYPFERRHSCQAAGVFWKKWPSLECSSIKSILSEHFYPSKDEQLSATESLSK